jgi:hypothetical protein
MTVEERRIRVRANWRAYYNRAHRGMSPKQARAMAEQELIRELTRHTIVRPKPIADREAHARALDRFILAASAYRQRHPKSHHRVLVKKVRDALATLEATFTSRFEIEERVSRACREEVVTA